MDIPSKDDQSYFTGNKFVTELSSKDFDEKEPWKLKSGKCTAILFYAPWCPHCKNVKDTWIELGKIATFFDICAFNCVSNVEHYEKMKEDLPDLRNGFPTMIVYKKGEPSEMIGETSEDRKLNNFLKSCMRICESS
jgi:thiol-disulfide isomerase/thioredoxin